MNKRINNFVNNSSRASINKRQQPNYDRPQRNQINRPNQPINNVNNQPLSQGNSMNEFRNMSPNASQAPQGTNQPMGNMPPNQPQQPQNRGYSYNTPYNQQPMDHNVNPWPPIPKNLQNYSSVPPHPWGIPDPNYQSPTNNNLYKGPNNQQTTHSFQQSINKQPIDAPIQQGTTQMNNYGPQGTENNNQFNTRQPEPRPNANNVYYNQQNVPSQHQHNPNARKINGNRLHRHILANMTIVPPNLNQAAAEWGKQGASPKLIYDLIQSISNSLPQPLSVGKMNQALYIGKSNIVRKKSTSWTIKLLNDVAYGIPGKQPFGTLISIAMSTLFAVKGSPNYLNITFRLIQIANHYGLSNRELNKVMNRAIYYKKQHRTNNNHNNTQNRNN